ncbi:MAG: ParB/RepB/Spo0J family partition protein [Oscillospiraceae bacterium]|nr:ParB/RepB/Spo0J family partition protein [Oscillospiraceae bacterium]
MAVKKGGLGRGLDSLFIDSAGTGAGNIAPTTIKLAEIEPDKNQPRKVFDEEALADLTASVTQHGVVTPIVLRPKPLGGYSIIAGERRFRAARAAGLLEIPAVVMDVTDDVAREIALIENLQREDLNPVEEAKGYKQLMEAGNLTQEQAAKKLGKSRPVIANALRLLALSDKVLDMLQEGFITTGHAKVLLSLENVDLQEQAAEIIAAQGLSVRSTEDLCKKLKKGPVKATMKPIDTLAVETEHSLKQVLGTEVKVNYKKGKGSLTVSFYSDEQLLAFTNLLGKYKKETNE